MKTSAVLCLLCILVIGVYSSFDFGSHYRMKHLRKHVEVRLFNNDFINILTLMSLFQSSNSTLMADMNAKAREFIPGKRSICMLVYTTINRRIEDRIL